MGIGCEANESDPAGRPSVDKPLKEIVSEAFPKGNVFIGIASHYSLFGTRTMKIVDSLFSYVTPSNDFKQTSIHPLPGKWDWSKSDAWVEHCKMEKQLIRMHAPISPQCSPWVKEDNRTPAELETMLTEYMTALCTKYNRVQGIIWLDVVNETIDKENGNWFGPKPGTTEWENPWPKMGFDETVPLRPPLYIKKAFEIAAKNAPDIKLIINQHGALEEASWVKMKQLVEYLRKNNLRVDGLGWQAHIDLGWEKISGNLERLAGIVDWCHQNNLEFHITEFNVWLKPGNEMKREDQARTYTSISKVLLDRHKSGVVGINFWQLRSSETMNKTWDGCLYSEELLPKPAYFAIRDLLLSYLP
jgi:GH35 family endo-1,4-beta-xylanase